MPGFNGQLSLFNATTNSSIKINYNDIENIVKDIVCFTAGSVITTPDGPRKVEALRSGDKVFTRDNGPQEICWVGHRSLGASDLKSGPALRPIQTRAGTSGPDLPETDMLVSPNHRVLITSARSQYFFAEHEVLVAAKYLADCPGVTRRALPNVTYVHFMCQHHEIVRSDGAWTESFRPGDTAVSALQNEQRDELLRIFPTLAEEDGRKRYWTARRTLKRHEVRVLTMNGALPLM